MDGLEDTAQTAAEHAAAAAAAGGRPVRTRPSRPAALEPDVPDGACANCEAPLHGSVCHVCGQVDDEYHRPVRGLLQEIAEGVAALDGRVARTIPALLFLPGRVTRDFLKGRRARYMPPFRLYIIASLIFFLLAPGVGNLVGQIEENFAGEASRGEIAAEIGAAVAAGEMTEDEAAQARAVLGRVGLVRPEEAAPADPPDTGTDESSLLGVELGDGAVTSSDPQTILRYFAPEDFGLPPPDTVWPLQVRRHVGARFAEVAADPGGWIEAAADWVPRIMFVMVPVYASLLSLVYVWRRGFYFYDHLIVSLHFHAVLFIAMTVAMKIGAIAGGAAMLGLLIYANAYLYRLHRVVYARGRISSVLRTLTLDVLYTFVLSFGFVAVLLLGALA